MTDLEEHLLRQVIVGAFNMYRLALSNRSPNGTAFYDLMRQPRVGDLVVETSTGPGVWQDGEALLLRGSNDPWHQVGRLIAQERRPINAPDWDTATEGPLPLEECWDVERLSDKGITTWRNADFIRIPEGAL